MRVRVEDLPPEKKGAYDALLAVFNDQMVDMMPGDAWEVLLNFYANVVVNGFNLPIMAAAADLIRACRDEEEDIVKVVKTEEKPS